MKTLPVVFFGFLLWASLDILISLWIGHWNLLAVPVLFISLVMAYLIIQKCRNSFEQAKVPSVVLMLFFLMLVLSAYPLLLVHPFFPASSDVLHVTNVRILQQTIPDTYAPYSNLAFTYQIGFALFSNAWTEILPFIPDYQVIWALGVLFSGLLIIFVYFLVRAFSNNETAALISTILVFGAKFVFTNFYFGVFPLVASFVFLLASLFLLEQKNPLFFVFFPTTIALHPFTGIALTGIVFILTLWRHEWKWGVLSGLCALLSLPSLLRTYATVLSNSAAGLGTFNLKMFLASLIQIPFWLGWVPFGVFVLAFIFFPKKEKQIIWIWLTLLFGIFAVFFVSLSLAHADKFFWLFSIFSVLSAGLFFASPHWKSISRHVSRQLFGWLLVGLLVLSLSSFFLSSELTRARTGSKATVADEEFALAFRSFDPELKKTVFLAKGAGWIAAISNKIPFDVRNSHFVPDSEIQVVGNQGWQEVLARHELQLQIESGCLSCLFKSQNDYLVVNSSQYHFPVELPKVFEYKNFAVYAIRGLSK